MEGIMRVDEMMLTGLCECCDECLADEDCNAAEFDRRVDAHPEALFIAKGCTCECQRSLRYNKPQFPNLNQAFLQAMNEIGQLGLDKYGEECIERRAARGDFSRTSRTKSRAIAEHARVHFEEYIDGVKHDVYNTRKHQLAAVAFNAMMEFQLAQLEEEK